MNKLARNIRTAGSAFRFVLIFLALAIALSGCEYFLTLAGKRPDDSVRIIYNVYSETFTDDNGVPILDANIVYPQIVNEDNKYEIDDINHYLRDQMKAYLDIIATDGVQYARSDLVASVEAEYDFIIHTYTQMPKITYNGNGYLSILYLRMEFTGGTRPNIFLSADSFKVTTGDHLTLTDFLGAKATETVTDVAARKIRQAWQDNTVRYYDTYKRDVEKRYNTEDFYLSDKALSVFYQAETIAPYTAGFPTFDIPYNDFRMRKRVPAISGTDVLAELYIEAGELLERNNIIFSEIYGLSMLDMDIPKGKTDETFFPVIDPRFTRYDDLAGYLRETYTAEVANGLLNNGMYKDVFGSLYGNPGSMAGKGEVRYTVDWSSYGFEVMQESDTKAKLIIYTNEETSSGPKEIKITAGLVNESGKWLLTKMVY